ncbi:MAG TPA: transglycosylase SLT domain-containing protein, partial [Marmoricola sp.]|nr:transglycosylase SLT domain-containing protein [Marmoricola sp.]
IARAVAAVRAQYFYPHATRWPGHRDRILIKRTVVRGDTLYSLAVHYRAWTSEIASLNQVSTLRPGQRIRIPIVVSVMREAERAAIARAVKAASASPHRTTRHARRLSYAQRMRAAGWRNWTMNRSQIRGTIIATARHHRVDPKLALAIGWQESGWQQPLISSAGAIGVMQLLPSTASWMGFYAGRALNPRHTRDNILAGVLFLKYLGNLAGPNHRGQIIAGYYQGLTALGRKRFWYSDTKRYVRSVSAIYRSLP